ncbi:hypothetical protein Q9R32_04845 [Actinotalea sp. AC32]|nr:hypothetical protein [Actinotalea sp. AC32]
MTGNGNPSRGRQGTRSADGTEGTEDLRARFEDVAPVILVDPEPVVRRGRRRRAAVRALSGLGVVAAVLAVVLVVRPGGGAGPAVTAPPPAEQSRPVAIQVAPAVVEPGGVVTVVLVASEANDLTFGVDAEVERWDGSRWRRAGVTMLCLVEWQCVGEVVGRIDAQPDIGLGATPGEPGLATVLSTEGLDDGWYRLVQRPNRGDVATGVFEVRTGAGAAPPQPPSDEVRLTVDPVIVPVEGGLVRVATQVPAGPDGTLTAEDIEAVDSVLDPSALVQRWTDDDWVDVVDVPVREREPALGVEWGSPVALPALDEGSYRVVRARPGGSPLWGVFTVTATAPPLEQPDDTADDGTQDDGTQDDGTDPADGSPDAGDVVGEDVFAPDHPMCAEQAGRCLLEAWWRDVTATVDVERGGGDHDFGILLTDSVRVGDGSVWLTLFPAEAPPAVVPQPAVVGSSRVGDATVEVGRWPDDVGGGDARRVTCGGFVLHTSSTDVPVDEVDQVVTALAAAMQPCPADVAALAARYPAHPPVP